MIKTDSKSKISALTLGRMEIKLGTTGEMSVESEHALQDSDGNVHGRSSFVGPWPTEVTKKIDELTVAVEKYLVSIHFEGTQDDAATEPNAGEGGRKKGLFGTGLGDAGTEADQL